MTAPARSPGRKETVAAYYETAVRIMDDYLRVERNFERYERTAWRLLRQHWGSVEAVAKDLLRERTLTGGQVEALCNLKEKGDKE